MSPYEHNARERKAMAIAYYLTSRLEAACSSPEALDEAIATLPYANDAFRRAMAARADQNPPSQKTWDRVAELVRKNQEIVRQLEASDFDPFVGLTDAEVA